MASAVQRGRPAELFGSYLDGLTAEPVDPVGPTVEILSPAGALLVGPVAPVRLALGSYRFLWPVPALLAMGAGYRALWKGTIAGVAAEASEALVVVDPPAVLPAGPIADLAPWSWRAWGRLPAYVRAADARELTGGGYPLARFLSLLGDQAGEVEALFDRFAYLSPAEGGPGGATSDLVDPRTADAAWLEWLAWLAGVELTPGLTVEAQRDVIAAGGARLGSKQAIIDVVARHLSGDRVVVVLAQDYAAGIAARPWSILVRTRTSETSILTAASLELTYATWAELTAAGSWAALAPDDIPAAIARAAVIPTGATIRHELGTLTWRRLADAGGTSPAGVDALGGSWAVLSDL